MRGSSFTFERIDLLEYHLHKISLNRGSSCIESPDWIKNKGTTINPKNTKDDNCFQYAIIAALNYDRNNGGIALNILYIPYNTKQIRQAYISKHNDKRNTQANLLMITDGTSNWHYLAVKSISGLLRGITSNHNGDFYCLNCFHSYTTERKLRKHEKICNDHDFCYLKMPDEDNKILTYIPGKKSLRASFIIYIDLECLL